MDNIKKLEIIKKLKTEDLNIVWGKTEDGMIGKSLPIVRPPFKFEEELIVMEGANDIYFKFTCDENNYFWVPISNKDNFLHLYDIYTKRYQAEYEDPKTIDRKLVVPILYENTVYYYGGLIQNVEKLENKMLFNKYLCRTYKNYKTAFWLTEQPKFNSTYYTMFSNSIISFDILTKFSVQLDTKNDTKKFHPMFIKINYPTAYHSGNRHKIMGDCMLYDVLHKDMPHDIWAALQHENVFDKDKIIDMIIGMSDDLKSEIDYLNFVLAALNELNTSP
jgi:hypothetical protein